MTKTQIAAAGYILTDNNGVIHAAAETVVDAWDALRRNVGPYVTIIADDDEAPEDGDYERESNYQCLGASAALMAQAEMDGHIKWERENGVACTEAESQRVWAAHDPI